MGTDIVPQSPKTTVSIPNFAWEIQQDLPELIRHHPTGVHVSHLHEYYGEPTARIMRAISYLVNKEKVTLHQAVNHSHYILPIGYVPATPHPELTDMQREVMDFIKNTCKAQNAKQLSTNYMQLARVLRRSAGGIRTCLARLEQLGYIQLQLNRLPGTQQTVLIVPLDHNLPS